MTRLRPYRRSLEGLVVGISISESSDSSDLGYSDREVNRVAVRIAEILLGEGAHLVFGHKWRRDGVMTEIHRLAVGYQAGDRPVITNLLPWPDDPGMTAAEQAEADRTLEIREVGLPPDLKEFEGQRMQPPATWLRARALTWMRRNILQTVHAQVCLGGRTGGSSGRFPGTVEEAYLLSQARKPLYLSGLLGGATREMIRAIRREEFSKAIFSTKESVQQAFDRVDIMSNDPDARLDRDALALHFQSLTMQRVQEANRLTESENRMLCDALNLDQALAMILRGLRRMRSEIPWEPEYAFRHTVLPIVFEEIESRQPARTRPWNTAILSRALDNEQDSNGPAVIYNAIPWPKQPHYPTLLMTAARVSIILATFFQADEFLAAVATRIMSLWGGRSRRLSVDQIQQLARLSEDGDDDKLSNWVECDGLFDLLQHKPGSNQPEDQAPTPESQAQPTTDGQD